MQQWVTRVPNYLICIYRNSLLLLLLFAAGEHLLQLVVRDLLRDLSGLRSLRRRRNEGRKIIRYSRARVHGSRIGGTESVQLYFPRRAR